MYFYFPFYRFHCHIVLVQDIMMKKPPMTLQTFRTVPGFLRLLRRAWLD